MGADTSTTHLIFFIAAMVIAAGVVGMIFTNVNAIINASHASGNTLSHQIATDIKIINDPDNIPKNGNIYIFYVKNTGKSTLTTELVNVLIEGEYIPDSDVQKTVMNGIDPSILRSCEVMQLNVTYASMPSGDNVIRVITENGVDDSLKFTIP